MSIELSDKSGSCETLLQLSQYLISVDLDVGRLLFGRYCFRGRSDQWGSYALLIQGHKRKHFRLSHRLFMENRVDSGDSVIRDRHSIYEKAFTTM